MCGIAGIIDHSIAADNALAVMKQMLEIQHHRGPDATGLWNDAGVVLGHNRLSIIDLSEAANQPMHFEDCSIIFNGEVYNYVEIGEELRRLGHRFVTHSDTEIILHAYKEWGEKCVEKFVGMWVFAIWEQKRRRLFISRDRFGIKPLYYILDNDKLYFASEIKTLKATPVFKSGFNVNQIARGLQMGWLSYHDETYYEGVKSLSAATNLIFEDGKMRLEKYWDLDVRQADNRPFKEKKDEFRELFLNSIRLHLRSDVPVASCLSGGIDSSAIVSAVQHLHPGHPYKTFSIFYDQTGDVDERPFIREVIGKYPAVEPVYYSPREDEIRAAFARALYHADAPATGSSFISQYFLMQLINANGIKVVLDGQGADEYLAGYMHSFYRLTAGLMLQGKIGEALRSESTVNRHLGNSLGSAASHAGKSLMAMVMDEQRLYAMEYKNYYPFVVDTDAAEIPFNLKKPEGGRLNSFLYHLMFTTSLPSLLQYEDRNSMAFSIESRVPFLDHRLVELTAKMQDNDKISGTVTKHVLRESMKDMLPPAIYQRKDKKGFVTPGENKWLRGPLSFLLEQDPGSIPFLRKDKVRSIFSSYQAGDNSKAALVWRIAVLGEWIRQNS